LRVAHAATQIEHNPMMTSPATRRRPICRVVGFTLAAALALAGCQTNGSGVTPTQTAPPTDAAAARVEAPLDVHQASARCWMKFDSNSRMTLDQKAEAVDKCIDETMRAQRR
jgi:hypothetical protein